MSKPFEWRILRVGSLRECLDAWQGSPLYSELDDSLRTASEITIDEIGSNFLRYSGPKAKEMLLKIMFDGKWITMTFDDDGAEFDPTSVPAPPSGNIALLPVGGRGINMARRSMDTWEYSRFEDKRNINVLRRRVARDPLATPTNAPLTEPPSLDNDATIAAPAPAPSPKPEPALEPFLDVADTGKPPGGFTSILPVPGQEARPPGTPPPLPTSPPSE